MKVISMDVNCPWCGAEPGQLCTEPKDYPPYHGPMDHWHGHLARTIEVPDAGAEVPDGE